MKNHLLIVPTIGALWMIWLDRSKWRELLIEQWEEIYKGEVDKKEDEV